MMIFLRCFNVAPSSAPVSYDGKILFPTHLSAFENHFATIHRRTCRMCSTQRRSGCQWRNHLQRFNAQRACRVAGRIATRDADAANSTLLNRTAQHVAQRRAEHFRCAPLEFCGDALVRAGFGGVNDDTAIILEKFRSRSHRALDFGGRGFLRSPKQPRPMALLQNHALTPKRSARWSPASNSPIR